MRRSDVASRRRDVTLFQHVADEIREQILSGQLAVDQPLRQTALAAQLGVSSIPLREALHQLEAEGLIKIYPYRGAVVTHISSAELLDLGNIMVGLEIQALSLALPHLTEKDLARAEQLSARRSTIRSPISAADLNYEFHAALYMPARSPRLLELIRRHHVLVRRYIHEFFAREEAARPPDRDLLLSCREGDERQAIGVLTRHIMEPVERVCSILDERTASSTQQ